jgi:hypothetical protein
MSPAFLTSLRQSFPVQQFTAGMSRRVPVLQCGLSDGPATQDEQKWCEGLAQTHRCAYPDNGTGVLAAW